MKAIAICVLSAFTAVLTCPLPLLAQGPCDASADPPTPVEQAVIDETNAVRIAYNLQPLIYSPALERVARYKARLMAQQGVVAHDDGFRTWQQRFSDCGFDPDTQLLGENLAAGEHYPFQVEMDWLTSPHHMENELRPGFHYLAVAQAHGVGPYGDYWVKEFSQ